MKTRRWVAVVVGLVVVGAIEVYLWTLNPEIKDLPPQPNPRESLPYLQSGDIVPAFEVQDPGGKIERIDYALDGKTLLFVLSATCGICRSTIPVWNRIAREAPEDVRVFGLLVSGGSDYSYQAEQKLLESGELGFPTFRFPDGETLKQYKVTKVPQTILVGSGGKVEFCLPGGLKEELTDEILAHLGPSDPRGAS